MIKIYIESHPDVPEKVEKKKPSLKERIEYAIDCIACNVSKKKAIAFLQKVKANMDAEPRQDREFQDLLNLVNTALADYGHYHVKDK